MPSRGLNDCKFIGNLGADCELREVNGSKVVNVSIAVNEVWGKDEQTQQKVEWVPLVFWGRLAEIVGQYCRKGSKLFIGGRLQTRNWEDDKGDKHYRTEVVVRDMLMLDSSEGESRQEEEDLPF